MSGCGLLLRAGVAPTPQMELLFRDPDSSFVFGDVRAKQAFPGKAKGCGGSARRFVQFCSFLHIQNWNEREWKMTDEKGVFDKNRAGPMAKCEPMLS
jgi:hypothetical protein